MDLIVETDAPDSHPGFRGDSADLLAFLTFGASERYGSLHPLSGVANILRRKHGVDLTPLLTFGDGEPDDEEDERELIRLWQDPRRLADCCDAAVAAIDASARLRELASGAPQLALRLQDLARIGRWAAERGANVRITYRL